MFKRTKICTGVLVALGGALTASALPAFAQEATRVEITGSRIKSIGATSASPITSVGVEEINSTQPSAVEEVIRGLPAAVPAIGPNVNNGSGGAAREEVDALQQCDGNGVGVHHASQVERHHAAAVDQHQRAVGAQAAQINGGAAS